MILILTEIILNYLNYIRSIKNLKIDEIITKNGQFVDKSSISVKY